VDLFNHLDEIIKQKVNLSLLKEYYFSYLPIIFVQITPISYLLAILYVLGNLSRHNEIIAMRSAGLSILNITAPIIILSIVLSVLVFIVNDRVVPSSLEIFEKIKNKIQKESITKEKEEKISNLCVYGLKNRLFFINKLDPKNNLLSGITILEEDQKQNIIRKILASEGKWENRTWTFSNVIIYNYENDKLKDNIEHYTEQIMDIPETPQDFIKQRGNPQTMNLLQLRNYILRLQKSFAKNIVKNLEIEFYHRIFFSFASLITALIGIFFALRIKTRVSALSSFGVSFGIGFLYYIMDAIFLALGKNISLSPFLSAGLAHMIFLSLSLYFIYKL